MKKDKKNNKKLTKKGKLKLVFLIIMLLLVAFIVAYFTLFNNTSNNQKVKVVDEIKKFDYTVSETDTKLFKDNFKKLKEVLNSDNIDNKEYATLISELFIIDFYTLDNKLTKNDVGGVQFVYKTYQSDFVDKARNGIYKQVKNNLYNDRKQSLPEVSSIEVVSVEEVVPSTIFESEDFKDVTDAESYEVSLKWKYKNNDDFQTTATVVVVKDADKLSIAKLSNE